MKQKIKIVYINDVKGKPFVTVKTENDESIKLTRAERNVLMDYKNKSYLENIRKCFSNPSIIADGFTVIKNGKITYTTNNQGL